MSVKRVLLGSRGRDVTLKKQQFPCANYTLEDLPTFSYDTCTNAEDRSRTAGLLLFIGHDNQVQLFQITSPSEDAYCFSSRYSHPHKVVCKYTKQQLHEWVMELWHRDTILFQSATLKENICKKSHFYRDAIPLEVLSKSMSLQMRLQKILCSCRLQFAGQRSLLSSWMLVID